MRDKRSAPDPGFALSTEHCEEAMRKVGPDTYVCTLCNTTIPVSGEESPVDIVAESGQPNMRIVCVAGVEVHRCIVADNPRSVRLGLS